MSKIHDSRFLLGKVFEGSLHPSPSQVVFPGPQCYRTVAGWDLGVVTPGVEVLDSP